MVARASPSAGEPETFESLRPEGVGAEEWASEAIEVLHKLQHTKPPSRFGAALLVISLLLFAVTYGGQSQLHLALVIGILLVHELGHLAAMKICGYRDTRMLFIPFLGAAVSGRKENASQVERAWIALAGPFPGILLGSAALFGIASRWIEPQPAAVFTAAAWTIGLNLANLIPLHPFDGGHFFDALIFSRHAVLETACKFLAAALLGLAAWLAGSWVLGALSGLMLLSLGMVYRTAALSRTFRQLEFNSQPALEKHAPDMQLRAYLEARKRYPDVKGVAPSRMIDLRLQLLRGAYGRSVARIASWPATLLMCLLYGSAFPLAALGLAHGLPGGPSQAVWLVSKANRSAMKGDFKTAIAEAQEAVKLNPQHAAAHAALSHWHYLSGNLSAARTHAQRAVELEPRAPDPYTVLVYVALFDGEEAEARAQLEALRRNGSFRETRETIERLEGELGLLEALHNRKAGPND